jgi:putative component of toxin-antitoxin plasmid stabilization module
LARLDRVVQARIDAALVRFAATGHGDVKSLKDRPGELRLRVGSGVSFSASNHLISSASLALTTGVKLTDQPHGTRRSGDMPLTERT